MPCNDLAPESEAKSAFAAVEYTPNSVDILTDQGNLARKGFILDADLGKMTLRNMIDHCS
ncbi:hypothetical protein RugamoR64_38550 [Duganella rhizosphaerae]|uniref:hypothetical protein n=1 Tax=Duganella rhizosphaerae TaxID=2885763 RepID=UPI0030E85F9D